MEIQQSGILAWIPSEQAIKESS